MQDITEEKLQQRFPLLLESSYYTDRPKTPIQIECGKGWYPIIWEICEKVEDCARIGNIKLGQNDEGTGFYFVQVKEKFGTLRIYTSFSYDLIDLVIDWGTQMSHLICEVCGGVGKTERGSNGWINTLCKKCREKNTLESAE